ncbi:MAG: 7TM-DISM domain-containing protein, partial [Leptospiraceae bacterium]|nr:7TM-DISM domain-containing protein [Leptospiraceae bacterium]
MTLNFLKSKKLHYLFILLFLFFGNCNYEEKLDSSTELLNLAGEGWIFIQEDNIKYSKPETATEGWDKISIPSNLRYIETERKPVYWIRKTFEFDPSFAKKNLALTLGRIYERDEVYFNGKLIGINGKRPDDINQAEHAYNRMRIYPIPYKLLIPGQNTVAVRITSSFSNYSGIISEPVGIASLQSAKDFLLYSSVIDMVYSALFLFIGVFFLINYFKMREMNEYLTFSLFIIIFALYEFCKNELRFFIFDNFLVFKFLELAFLFQIPYLYILFFQSAYKIKPFKNQIYYLVFNSVLPLLFIAYRKPSFWAIVLSFWAVHLIIPLSYSAYYSYKKIKEKNKEAIFFSIALLFFIYGVLMEILIERGIIVSQSSLDDSLLFFVICNTIILRFRFISLKLNIQKRFEQLSEFDKLRENLFHYMNKILMPSIENSLQVVRSSKADVDNYNSDSIVTINSNLEVIDSSVDDILELSRLEVKEDSPLKDTVNFVDFIKTIIPEGEISYTIKVDPAFQIHNTLDLVNSLMIRIIDFSGFKSFTSKDLIVTSDLKNQLHFRFMFYQSDLKSTFSIYKKLMYGEVQDILTVRWSIIKEIMRLLEGKLEMAL